MKHTSIPESFDGNLEKLAIQIGDLKYDALEELFLLLSNKIATDAEKDEKRGRMKLSSNLFEIADLLRQAKEKTGRVWQICKPYMKNE